ncbi:MAG: Glyoxylate/hydroxypyruvate reductase B [Candidatus Moanabacter tarae]|uniref:Glyoxylate/hydroxypyruvate reductase B n=1 Tax=Candidatus Moanibacter tarae TaxID=2200854 RepID=A0A2Z4ACI7_9BACT|nr:MAG: Glyoxylate/hydroxypyruvate reductase B [Candidatus Moanabacter tarae]|tara:strand:- start:5373 stop:6344 length:972 start_codon:yes stop_codon:yes gene_type:complete
MKNNQKVHLALQLETDLKEKLNALFQVTEENPDASKSEILSAIADVEGILGFPNLSMDADFFDAAPNLRVLSLASVGYDFVDVDAATKRGIVICNTPGVLTNAVANLTISMIFIITRKLIENETFVRTGGWARGKPAPALGTDIEGKVLGLIGFGRIGQEVARRAQALGMKTLWYDVFDTLPDGAPNSDYRKLDNLLEESDFVSLHTNLSPSARHLIGEVQLDKMKETAYLINTARGPLVDQSSLTKALKSGTIAGAALDVFESEPTAENEPITQLTNAYCFAHIASGTEETRRAMRELALQNLIAVLSGNHPPAPVNPEVFK